MKTGMEMMLDSMGIQTGAVKQLLDPANIKALLSKIEAMCKETTVTLFEVTEIKDSVRRIETKLGTLPESIAMKLLADGQSEAFKETVEFVRTYNDRNDRDSNDGNEINTRTDIGNDATGGNGRGL